MPTLLITPLNIQPTMKFARRHFITVHSKLPAAFYLGRHEMQCYEASLDFRYTTPDSTGNAERKFQDVRVFKVDADSHFGLGI